jgi:glycosyltransferase involved in cell wall biosynthesis
MTSAAPVSVVISCLDEGALLAATVHNLLEASAVPAEIVVVDDGSSDGSCDRPWPSSVRVIKQANTGIAPARNRGALAATQPFLVFLDAHCTVESGWLDPLLDGLRRHPGALVGAAVRDVAEPRFVGCGAEIVDELFTYRWRRAVGSSTVEVGLVPGGCLAVERRHFLDAGGFAAFTGVGLEDVELALRWWRAGRHVLGAPTSVVTQLFRHRSPGPEGHQRWVQNVLRTALLHLSGAHLRATVVACSRFACFGHAMGEVLAEAWIPAHLRLATGEVRSSAEYLVRWAPRAFRVNHVHDAAPTSPSPREPEPGSDSAEPSTG